MSDDQRLEPHARQLVRCLLGEDPGGPQPRADLLIALARENVALVRVAEWLERHGRPADRDVVELAAAERERVSRTLDLIGSIGQLCESAGVAFVFPKAFQHYPDMGHDVDLLIERSDHRIDELLVDRLGAGRAERGTFDPLAGKTAFRVPAYVTPVEVHHGRLGHVGEHRRYAAEVVGRRRPVTVDGLRSYEPAPADQLLMQVLQRVYLHHSFRLSDVATGIRLVRGGAIDLDQVMDLADGTGTRSAVRFYLGALSRIHVQIFGSPLAPPGGPLVRPVDDWVVRFASSRYRFATVPVLARMYSSKLLADVRVGDWPSVARLAFLPPLGALAGARSFARRR